MIFFRHTLHKPFLYLGSLFSLWSVQLCNQSDDRNLNSNWHSHFYCLQFLLMNIKQTHTPTLKTFFCNFLPAILLLVSLLVTICLWVCQIFSSLWLLGSTNPLRAFRLNTHECLWMRNSHADWENADACRNTKAVNKRFSYSMAFLDLFSGFFFGTDTMLIKLRLRSLSSVTRVFRTPPERLSVASIRARSGWVI